MLINNFIDLVVKVIILNDLVWVMEVDGMVFIKIVYDFNYFVEFGIDYVFNW